jgi:hypothetical protein
MGKDCLHGGLLRLKSEILGSRAAPKRRSTSPASGACWSSEQPAGIGADALGGTGRSNPASSAITAEISAHGHDPKRDGEPDRLSLSRMLLLGFIGTVCGSSAIDETDRKAFSPRNRPVSLVPRARLADGGVGCASRWAPD